jgi:hypothetical protein
MKNISINRTVQNVVSTSTLVMEKGKLVVLGNLPHGAEISFTHYEAAKLRAWLNANYAFKEDYETRNGLLYMKGETNDKNYIPTHQADSIARKLGFMYVEQLVAHLKEVNPR